MRWRRAGGNSSFGAPRATRRDMAAKSKISAWLPPTAARKACGLRPACEWAQAARRISDRPRISVSTMARNSPALRCCAWRQACVISCAGSWASQPATMPSSCRDSAAWASTGPAATSARASASAPSRAAASAHSADNSPCAPAATALRISCSRRSRCRRSRSPSTPRGASSSASRLTTVDSETAKPSSPGASSSTTGKSWRSRSRSR